MSSGKDNVLVIYIYKAKNGETFLYTKIQTLCKKQDNLRYVFIYKNLDTFRYASFHEIFEDDICIQKSWHFALRDFFIYKKSDTPQKVRQFALGFLIYKKPDILCYTIFHGIFEIGGGEGAFL